MPPPAPGPRVALRIGLALAGVLSLASLGAAARRTLAGAGTAALLGASPSSEIGPLRGAVPRARSARAVNPPRAR